MEASQSLLQRNRSDRRQLLSFILSSGLIKGLRSPTGATSSVSDSDLELLSADYVLQCAQFATQQQRGDPTAKRRPIHSLRRPPATAMQREFRKHLVLSLLASLRLPSGEKLVRICGPPAYQQTASNWIRVLSLFPLEPLEQIQDNAL